MGVAWSSFCCDPHLPPAACSTVQWWIGAHAYSLVCGCRDAPEGIPGQGSNSPCFLKSAGEQWQQQHSIWSRSSSSTNSGGGSTAAAARQCRDGRVYIQVHFRELPDATEGPTLREVAEQISRVPAHPAGTRTAAAVATAKWGQLCSCCRTCTLLKSSP